MQTEALSQTEAPRQTGLQRNRCGTTDRAPTMTTDDSTQTEAFMLIQASTYMLAIVQMQDTLQTEYFLISGQ